MIRDSLAVVVVTRRHPERLSATLASLAADKVPGTVTVVNLTGDSVPLTGQMEIVGASTLSLSHAVDLAIAGSSAETVWVLRDDTSVRPGAFSALASVLDTSPSVGVVGPKQMDAASPVTIREMGESMTRSGYALQIAERELDQAQFDRTTDVLAVGEAGMLVRRSVWMSLNGFDPALPALGGALDFCFRARSAGWLVEVVPAAVIDTAVTSYEALVGEVTASQAEREEARARAHRVLVYGPAAVRPFIAFGLTLGALVRGVGRFLRKRVNPFAEWRGSVAGVLDLGAITRSHRSYRAMMTNPVGGGRLFVSPADLRHRRAMQRDEERAKQEAADDTPRLEFSAAAMWFAGLATVLGLALNGRFLGATALSGGALIPMPASVAEALDAIGATWSDVAGGIHAAPDGFAALMGIMGSLTWWDPNLIVVTLFAFAIPLSFVAGFVGAGSLTTNSRVAIVVGAGWALLPTLHVAISEGRITALLAHIALPLFARAIVGSTTLSLGWAAILGAIAWVSVPALAPVIVTVVIIRAVTGTPTAMFALLPALAFEWPRLLESMANPVAYFADRGVPFPTGAPHGLGSLTLWPTMPSFPGIDTEIATLAAFVVVAVCLALTVIAVVVAENPRVGALLLAGATALLTWAALGPLTLATSDGQPVGLFPGPLYDVVWFGLLSGAAITISAIRFAAGFLAPIAVAVIAAVGFVPLTAVATGMSLVAPSSVRTLPAYVQAETTAHPGGATLILSPTADGIRAELQRDAGVTLVEWTAAAATRLTLAEHEGAIAELAANLIVESDFDVAAAVSEAGIRFLVLEALPTAPEVSAIASHAGLTSVGVTDRGILWRVNEPVEATPVNRAPDLGFRVILGLVGLVALIAAVPTSLPRRRPVMDDLAPVTGEVEDEHS
jgi:hypothetical protein